MVEQTLLFSQLTILLSIAVASHFFIKRFHQPTVIGEIGIGIVMGPTVVGFILSGWRPPPAVSPPGIFDETFIAIFAALGAMFLLFLIGLESEFRAIYTRKNVYVAIGGVALPFVAGFAIAFVMLDEPLIPLGSNRFAVATFVGAILVATSTAIAASVLADLGLMRTSVAQTIMGAAIVDDILGLIILALAKGVGTGTVAPLNIGLLLAAAVGFVAIGTYLGVKYFSRVVVAVQVRGLKLGLKHGGFLIAVAIAFAYAAVAELIGLSAIIGAFVAGAMFASTPLREDFHEATEYLTAIFSPIFFISLGLLVNLWTMTVTLVGFGAVLVVFAIVTKLLGCELPARWSGMSKHASRAVGYGMVPRGEVGLVVALAAVTAGVIETNLFSAMVIVIILVSILPAPFLRRELMRLEATEKRPAPE